MSKKIDIKTLIYSLLNTAEMRAIIPDSDGNIRIFVDRMPGDVEYPAGRIYFRNTINEFDTGKKTAFLQIDLYGENVDELDEISDIIDDNLNGWDGISENIKVKSIIKENDLYNPQEFNTQLFHKILEYKIYYI